MLRRLVKGLLCQRPERHIVSGGRSAVGACHEDRHENSTAESMLRTEPTLHLNSTLAEQRCLSSSKASSRWKRCYERATGCRSFTARATPQLENNAFSEPVSSTWHNALASHYPPTDDHQVQAVLVASMTKLLCGPPTPALASIKPESASSNAARRGGTPDTTSSAQEDAAVKSSFSAMSDQSPADKEQAKKQAAYRYGSAQRERYQANIAKHRSKRPQQDFTRYHEKLKAEARAAREMPHLEEHSAAPAHSPEAMQELARTVASVLGKDEHEVLTLLQQSAYGRQQDPTSLPDTDQVRATLQEMLRIYGVIAKYNPVNTVWGKALGRNPMLLSCTVDQIRNTVSFLEMLDMTPPQITVCLSKAPVLLAQNLEDKLLPLCDYLNRIGLDLKKQRTLVTWRPEVLSQRLDWVKGQCALLAGNGIQGDVLANVLYKSSKLIMTPRKNLALRLKYLFAELGCTPEDVRRGAGIVGIEAQVVAFRVAWLKHLGREIQLPSQVPGGLAEWKQYVDHIRGKKSFGPEEPMPIWIAVRCTLRRLCAMMQCDLGEARTFERDWRRSEEARKWSGAHWKGKKKPSVRQSSDSQTAPTQDLEA